MSDVQITEHTKQYDNTESQLPQPVNGGVFFLDLGVFMRFQRLQALIFMPLFLMSLWGIVVPQVRAQEHTHVHTHTPPAHTQGDAAYQTKRQQAMQFFDQGKRLEALPLLEDLVKEDAADQEVVVALAASLVRHAATLTDQQEAGKERLRAKDLLEKSGSFSPLAQNLLQLLRQMPESGDIQFSENPAVEQAMRAGEAAFSRRDFDEAIKNYSRAAELEPKNYAAVLFIGNAFHKKNDFARAGEWYEKAIPLDPNIETAYRYYAEMLAREGNMAKARTMLIHAATAEPYNRMVWRDLKTWATVNHVALDFTYVDIPAPNKDELAREAKFNFIDPKVFPDPEPKPKDVSDAWQAYHSVRAKWKQGGKFKQRFPQEADYRRSLAEETEALTAAINVLDKLRRDIDTAELVTEDQSLLLLLKLRQVGLLESYVLFRAGDEGIAKDYSAYRARSREKLEEYLDKFVVPPAPKMENAR
jgi:tetratricopeptide (TPR) repeat protein